MAGFSMSSCPPVYRGIAPIEIGKMQLQQMSVIGLGNLPWQVGAGVSACALVSVTTAVHAMTSAMPIARRIRVVMANPQAASHQSVDAFRLARLVLAHAGYRGVA